MGRGRGRVGGGVRRSARWRLPAAGCGAESHPNEPRPAPPTRVSVTITPKAVTVQPATDRRSARNSTQQIPQNQNHPQPPIQHRRPARRRLRHRQPDRHRLQPRVRGPQRRRPPDRWSPTAPARSRPTCRPASTRSPPPTSPAPSRPSSSSAPTAPPPRTTSCCPSDGAASSGFSRRRRLRLGVRHHRWSMTVVLAIAVVSSPRGSSTRSSRGARSRWSSPTSGRRSRRRPRRRSPT